MCKAKADGLCKLLTSKPILLTAFIPARGSLKALDQIVLDSSCAACDRSGVCRTKQNRCLPGGWDGTATPPA